MLFKLRPKAQIRAFMKEVGNKKSKVIIRVDDYVYYGLGFPVEFYSVTLIRINGKWFLDTDMNLLQSDVIEYLLKAGYVPSGNQVKFIRAWLGFTKKEFIEKIPGLSSLGFEERHVDSFEESGNERSPICGLTWVLISIELNRVRRLRELNSIKKELESGREKVIQICKRNKEDERRE